MKESYIIKWFLFGIIPVLILALFANLHLPSPIGDEAIRMLVALEMKLSNNYIVPTLHGDLYFNKPPLFNWIIIFFSELFRDYSIKTGRLVTVFFLLCYVIGVYFVFKRQIVFSKKGALFVAFFLLTCGRVIFWDSKLALIDITFSFFIFLMFYCLYFFSKSSQSWLLFFSVYTLGAIAFMLKGLPSIVFLGISITSWLFLKKQFNFFFSVQHVLAGICFLLIIFFYYYLYNKEQPLEPLLIRLFDESAKRTAVDKNIGLLDTIIHFFSFPLEMIYHFAPWSLFTIFLIERKILTRLKGNDFVMFTAFIFIVNVFIYWLSPGVFPRYLLMFCPLYFGIGYYLYKLHKLESTIHFKIFTKILSALVVLILIGLLFAFVLISSQFPVHPDLTNYLRIVNDELLISFRLLLIFLISIIGGYIFFYYLKKGSDLYFIGLFIIILSLRIGFNWFSSEMRQFNNELITIENQSDDLSKIVGKNQVFIFNNVTINDINVYLISLKTGTMFKRKNELTKDQFYIFDDPSLKILDGDYELKYTFLDKSKNNLHLIKINN